MKRGKQDNKISIAVIINELSWEQLSILGKHFKQPSNKFNILLVKKMPCLPIAFYMLRKILLLEKQLNPVIKEELQKSSSVFNVPLMRKVVQGSALIYVFQALPKDNDIIGYQLDKHHLFIGSNHPSFMDTLRRHMRCSVTKT